MDPTDGLSGLRPCPTGGDGTSQKMVVHWFVETKKVMSTWTTIAWGMMRYIYMCVYLYLYICRGGVRVELDKLLLIGRNDTTRPDAYSFLVSKGIRIHHPFVVLPCRSVFWGQTNKRVSERAREGRNEQVDPHHPPGRSKTLAFRTRRIVRVPSVWTASVNCLHPPTY
jgi:hypothetical protein